MPVFPRLFAAAACAALVAATPSFASAAAPTPAADDEGPTRYLVQFAPGTDVASAARDLRGRGVAVRQTFRHALDGAVVSATPAQAAVLVRDPGVLTVEQDRVVQASGTQRDATWGLDRLDQRVLPLDQSYTSDGDGKRVTAYVVDTGLASKHPEFRGRVGRGFSVIDDGRGTEDCSGHGTHVAGTVAGTTYGVADAATVVPVRVLDCNGGGLASGVVAGLDWIVAHHGSAPAVVNMSLNGRGSAVLDAALERVIADGVVAAVAAGNDSADACKDSPARVPSALTVAASDRSDTQARFSNHGSCVDLFAPGVDITSAGLASTPVTASGTSMASPHVAGAAAVLLGTGMAQADVVATLLANATTDVVDLYSQNTPNRLLYLGSQPESDG
jgi:subtilisin family serine protease